MAFGRMPALALTLICGLAGGTAFAAPCGNDASGFDAWVADFRVDAAGLGISQGTIDSALSNVSYSDETMRRDRNQSVFRQSFEEFSGRMIPPRLGQARNRIDRYGSVLAGIEQQFGVPKEVVIAIWGLESDFGAVRGNQSILSSLATLAYDCRRGDFFTGQLVDALKIIERGDLSPDQMRGGYHGELGQTQFLPSSYIAFAVDYDGDGRANLLSSETDVLASTANYLRGYGWRTGQDWAPGTGNFGVIQQWNKSEVYSRTVAEFARQLAGG